jgi:hypothetical protein
METACLYVQLAVCPVHDTRQKLYENTRKKNSTNVLSFSSSLRKRIQKYIKNGGGGGGGGGEITQNMKNGVFWDVTPRSSCKNRRFGGT